MVANSELFRKEFEDLVRPLMDYLGKNHHPHTKIILDSMSAELVEGVIGLQTDEYVRD